jgi:hypothetical protein
MVLLKEKQHAAHWQTSLRAISAALSGGEPSLPLWARLLPECGSIRLNAS